MKKKVDQVFLSLEILVEIVVILWKFKSDMQTLVFFLIDWKLKSHLFCFFLSFSSRQDSRLEVPCNLDVP